MKTLTMVVVLSCSACSMASSAGDHITLTGTPAGMQAFADFTNGIIRTGKESADKPSEYFATREKQDVQETSRQSMGFWQKLVSK